MSGRPSSVPPARRPRRRRLTLVVAALAVLVGACSIPIDNEADDLSRPLPEALLPPASTTTTTPPPETRMVRIYLSRRIAEEERTVLAEVERELARDATIAAILNQVVQGPTADEDDVTAPFGEGTEVVAATFPAESTVLEVELSGLEGFPEGSNQRSLAWAMLVCTATDLLDVEVSGVRFLGPSGDDERAPLVVQVPAGNPAPGEPVDCTDYALYDPDTPPQPTTTTPASSTEPA